MARKALLATAAALSLMSFREAKADLPPLGIIGTDAVREAFEGDLRQLQDLLQGSIQKVLELSGDDDWWPYVHGLFEDFVVVEMKDGKLMRYPYEIDGTKVTLGNPIEVVKTFEPVSGNQPSPMMEATIEAAFIAREGDAEGSVYKIRVIRAGVSGNGNYYPDAVLREAAPMFNGVRVFVKSDEEHLAGKGKDVRNLIGALSDAAFVEGSSPDTGEIRATLTLIEAEGAIAVKIREAWSRQLTGLFGFSIDAVAYAKKSKRGTQDVREATKFVKVKSVDLIVEPGAAGEIIEMVEAQKEKVIMGRATLIALLEAKGHKKDKLDNMTDDQLVALVREALPDSGPGSDPQLQPGISEQSMREAIAMVERRGAMRIRVTESALPQPARDRVIATLGERESFTEADVEEAIRAELTYLSEALPNNHVADLGPVARIESGETRAEKVANMFEAFFDREHPDHRHARSFRECYIAVTGDRNVTGRMRDADPALMREALNSASFADVLGDHMYRRMMREYNVATPIDAWRRIVDVTDLNDFRTVERVRFGGYGDIPVVAEGADYLALGSPSDEKATYAAGKRGGLETITREMILNDDVNVIRQLPVKIARAAKRTLSKFAFDFILTNPVIYDGVALFHATHGNLGGAALADASFAAGRLAMQAQTELDSGQQLYVTPKYLLVPDDLEETAYNMFKRDTNNDETFVQSLKPEVVPVWCQADANDWHLLADPRDCTCIEIGFVNGQQEPEMFVQENPNEGSMFAADKLTYKVRHEYGGGITDYRGAYSSRPA